MLSPKNISRLSLAVAVLAAPVMAFAAPDAAAGHGAAPRSPLPSVNEGLVVALTTLTVFIVLLFILGKIAFGPIAAALAKREEKIRGDIASAEAANAKAQALLKEYEARLAKAEDEVRKLRADGVAAAERDATTLKAKALTEIEELRARSLNDIAKERTAAVNEIHAQAAELSVAIAEKILKRNINANDQQDLVRSSLQKLAGTN